MSKRSVGPMTITLFLVSLTSWSGCATDMASCPEGTAIPDFDEGGRTCVPVDDGGTPDGSPDRPPDASVECSSDVECPSFKEARCDDTTGTCEGCTDDVHCVGIDGLPRCDESNGSCVECKPATEEVDCGETSCDPATLSCTGIVRGSREMCEACLSDSDCSTDLFCVPMLYLNTPRAGGHCLESNDGGCARPFSIALRDRTSLSGETGGIYCGINEELSTCEAVLALLQDATCPGGENAECPQPAGLCRQVGELANRCTYECGGPVECDGAPRPGSTCGNHGMADEPEYCGG